MRNANQIDLKGIKQFKGTCYFNSVFNAFLLGSLGRKILYNSYLTYQVFIINNNKQNEFFNCIDTLLTQDDFCIQSNNISTLRMYFYAFVSILMCHKVSKKISRTNVDNLMAFIKEPRVASFGLSADAGGYSMRVFSNLLETMQMSKPIALNSFQNHQSIVSYNPLLMVTDIQNYNSVIPDVLVAIVNGVQHNYLLDHAVLQVFLGQPTGHAVVCFVSNGNKFVYDSNQDNAILYDWTDLPYQHSSNELNQYFDYLQNVQRYEFLYACYVAEDYAETLIDIPKECNWSGNLNNTAYMIYKQLALDRNNIHHIIIYDNNFLQKVLFPYNIDVFAYENAYFYNGNNYYESLQQNIDSSYLNGDILIYIICSEDCVPSTKGLGKLFPSKQNKIRVFIEQVKSQVKKLKRKKQIVIKQVVFSGVGLGYVGSFTTTYEKQISY
jgi:hypothetical protein